MSSGYSGGTSMTSLKRRIDILFSIINEDELRTANWMEVQYIREEVMDAASQGLLLFLFVGEGIVSTADRVLVVSGVTLHPTERRPDMFEEKGAFFHLEKKSEVFFIAGVYDDVAELQFRAFEIV